MATGWRSTVHPSGRDLSWNVVRAGFDSVISVGSGISITMGSGVRQMQLTHPKQTIIVAVCLINFILIIFSLADVPDVHSLDDTPNKKFHENLIHS